MFIWNIVDTNKCIYCNQIDTLEHHIFYCIECEKLCNGVITWTKDNLETCFQFTICDIIFGILIKEENIDLPNFIIIIGKWYINKMRTQNQELKLNYFLKLLKNKIDMIIHNKTINI